MKIINRFITLSLMITLMMGTIITFGLKIYRSHNAEIIYTP